MTRDQVNFTLRMMEQCRENMYEAETKAEARRLNQQYSAMWESIEPYVTEKKPYTETPTISKSTD